MSDSHQPGPRREVLSRRSFLKGAGGVAAGGVLTGTLAQAEPEPAGGRPRTLAGQLELELSINGQTRALQVEPRTTLLSALRTRLEPPLTGSKEVCDRGECGACTVIVDGRPAYACMLLAVDLMGRAVRTVEGLGTPQNMSPVQEAFCDRDALMCGFCTPGFVVATSACLERDPAAPLDEIKRQLAGNLCRCGTYPHIFQAALDAGQRMQEEGR